MKTEAPTQPAAQGAKAIRERMKVLRQFPEFRAMEQELFEFRQNRGELDKAKAYFDLFCSTSFINILDLKNCDACFSFQDRL